MELHFAMLFPYKLTRNLNKCPLTFIAKIYAPFITEYNPEKREGIEILMMDVMMSKINGTISYRYPGMESWGYKEPNGNNLYHYFNYFILGSSSFPGSTSLNSFQNFPCHQNAFFWNSVVFHPRKVPTATMFHHSVF